MISTNLSSFGINLDTLYSSLEELYDLGFFNNPAQIKSMTYFSDTKNKHQSFNDKYGKAKIPDLRRYGLIDENNKITPIGIFYINSNEGLKKLIQRVQLLYFFNFNTNKYPFYEFLKFFYYDYYKEKIYEKDIIKFLNNINEKISANIIKYFTNHLINVNFMEKIDDYFRLKPELLNVIDKILFKAPPIFEREIYYKYYRSSDLEEKLLFFRFCIM